MKKLRILWQILKTAGFVPLSGTFLAVFFISAFIIRRAEPTIHTFGDSLWYCFETVTTIGFGDYHAETLVGRWLTVLLAVYGVTVIAIFTGILVNFFQETQRMRLNDSISEFLDQLEHLDKLSSEELRTISAKIRKSRPKKNNREKQ